MARIIYMSGGGYMGVEILKWLKGINEDIVALVVASRGKDISKREEIIQDSPLTPVSGLTLEEIFVGDELRQPDVLEKMRQLKPEFILTVFFPHILKKESLDIPAVASINIHSTCLPYHRGAGGVMLSILEGTGAGVTMHYMDEGLDTGDIIAQKEVKVDFTDTYASLRMKLDITGIDLFKENWELIKKGKNKKIKQPAGGTCPSYKDLAKIREIDLNQTYKAEYLINLLRAFTGAPGQAYVQLDDGRQICISISLEETELRWSW